MHDTLFRSGSAVVNPEGEAPSTAAGEHESTTTVGLAPTMIRHNAEHEGKKPLRRGARGSDRAGDRCSNVRLRSSAPRQCCRWGTFRSRLCSL